MAYTFPMEHQEEPDWCWSAVAVSVQHYFDPNSKLTQPEFAVRALKVPLPEANQPWYLYKALADIERLSGNPQGPLAFADIQKELAANLPVCVHIDWNEGGSHFVVISGYRVSPGGNAQVYVSDPILQDSNVVLWDYDAFVMTYSPRYTHAEGTWVDTCLVRP
jgi:Papain-like cysteine protease AvrRpt2